MDINSLSALRGYTATRKPETGAAAASSVANSPTKAEAPSKLADAANEFADVFNNAEQQAIAATTGKADPQSVVEAMASAEMALETAVTIRDKVVEAYQELLRMPI